MADDRERAREHERERRRLAGDADIGGYDSVGNAFMPENPAPGDIDALYGVAGNGLPLDQLFVGVDADAAEEGISVMNAALALGENPRTVVTDLMNVMNIEQARALTIARTEMLGAWRDAQAINYRANSDVLDGWIWSSSLGGACIACVMMDGTVHPLDEDMDSHPNCACIMVPLTKSWDDLLGDIEGLDLSALDETDYLNQGFEDGQDWFLAQSEATQIEVLGPAKFEAWQSGDVDLLDFVGQRDAGAWGNEIYERSLKEIGLDANAYLGRTTLADVTGAAEARDAATTAEAATETANGVKIITTAYDGTDLTPQIEEATQRLFGEAKTPEELAALVGAPPGSEVIIDASRRPFGDNIAIYIRGPIVDSGGYPYRNFIGGQMVEEERAYVGTRFIAQENGELRIYNSTLFMGEGYQGQGLGVQIFSDEVQNAIAAGVDYIKTDAAGDGLIPLGTEDRANGYYTWARFGYIGDIPQTALDRLAAAIADGTAPAEWSNYTTVQELMTTPEGRDWWKANGSGWQGVFDLRDGSLSRQILADYLREKGMFTQADAIAGGA